MNLKNFALYILYFPFLIINRLFILLGLREDCRVRVILFHDIPEGAIETFREKILYLSKKWNFISPNEFENHLNGSLRLSGDNLLLTFDDGYKSNRVVAEEVLDQLSIKAIFFIISSFLDVKERKIINEFVKNNLFPEWKSSKTPIEVSNLKPMTSEDLNFLISKGHAIGAHTTTHANLASIESDSRLHEEIIQCGDKLEDKLGVKIKHFSFGFGNVCFFSKDALKLAKTRYEFIHTGMRGLNKRKGKKWAIRRDPLSLDDTSTLDNSFLEGAADYRYKKDFIEYESWLI